MYLLKKRKELSERERNIQKLKEELRICDERIKSCQLYVLQRPWPWQGRCALPSAKPPSPF